jgi:predicted adenylyl cyclase CyaB
MQQFNIALKARCEHIDVVRAFLISHNARFVGTDCQKDTYFNVPNGRLKFREGNMENVLIHHDGSALPDPNSGHVTLFTVQAGEQDCLKNLLDKAIGITRIIEKQREVYFIENVKFHLDEVQGLGDFVEIEAIDVDDSIGAEQLARQCQGYKEALGIREEDMLPHSYSELSPV